MSEFKHLRQLISTFLSTPNQAKNSKSNFLLIRKGQSIANESGSLAGWLDAKLSFIGRRQANNLCGVLYPLIDEFDSFHTSDLRRLIYSSKLSI